MSFGFGNSFGSNASLGTNGFEVSLDYLTGLPDPSILSSNDLKLIFKELQKRDGITRQKAITNLYDLLDKSHELKLDEIVIMSWCQMYPKLAIDQFRRVRSTAHKVQSKFVQILTKKYTKYLRDTIGVWVSGQFDSDRVTARTCRQSIFDSFKNDGSKVSALWKIFATQILDYCFQVIAFATKQTLSDERFIDADESEAKYNRVTLGAVLTFTEFINKLKGQSEISPKVRERIAKVLSNKQFLRLFENPDPKIKKAMYQFVRILFDTNKTLNIVDETLFSGLSREIIYGLKFKKHVNAILYSSVMVSILDALVVITHYNSSFWTNVKGASSFLLKFLRHGSLNSGPIYYDILVTLLLSLPTEFLCTNDYNQVKPYVTILEEDWKNESLKVYKSQAFKAYTEFGFECLKENSNKSLLDRMIVIILKVLDSDKIVKGLLEIFSKLTKFPKYLEILNSINAILINSLQLDTISFSDPSFKVNDLTLFVSNFIQIDPEDCLNKLVDNSSRMIQTSDTYPTVAFNAMHAIIKSTSFKNNDAIRESMQALPKYVDEDHAQECLSILTSYISSTSDSNYSSLIDSFFIAYKEVGNLQTFASSLKKMKSFNVKEAPNVRRYLLNASESKQKPSVLFQFLTPTILSNLFETAKNDRSRFESFVQDCTSNYQDEPIAKFACENFEFCIILLSTLSSQYSSTLIQKLEKHLNDPKFNKVYFSAYRKCYEKIEHRNLLKAHLQQLDPTFLNDLLDTLKDFEAKFPECPDQRLIISNAFGTGLYFFENSSSKWIDDEIYRYLNTIVFDGDALKIVKGTNHPDLLIQLAICGQIANDLAFIEHNNKKMNVFNSASETFNSLMKAAYFNDSFEELWNISGSQSAVLKSLFKYLQSTNNTLRYYAYRVYEQLIMKSNIEKVNATFFNQCITTSSPEKMYILLEAAPNAILSSSISILRNKTAANVVGLHRSMDIMNIGMKSLVYLNRLLTLGNDITVPEGLTLIPPQRFLREVNSICSWPDCDAAYEPEFISVRITLLEFVQTYLNNIYGACDSQYPSDCADNIFQLGLQQCSDNLEILASNDDQPLELLYFTLKTYNALWHYKSVINGWDGISEDDNLLTILLKRLNKKASSRMDYLINELLVQMVIKEVSEEKLLLQYQNFVKSLHGESSIFSLYIIDYLLPKVQDNLVVESALDKKKLNSITLPNCLVDDMKQMVYEEESHDTHLNSWYVLISHFVGISQEIKDIYIDQLGEQLIFDDLTLAMKEIDVENFRLSKDVVNLYMDNYHVELTPETAFDENERLRVMIKVFSIYMNYIGGSLAQRWYASIRDIQFKKSIGKFVTNYISPKLINDIGDTLTKKEELEDDKFKIKVSAGSREIRCICDIDDEIMQIAITLPLNYPLSQIAVKGISRIGVDEKKWKSWILSFQYVINFQNVSIMDAIKHFKDNVLSNFENYEDCAICYSIINAIDHSTPNKTCSTCHHSFHSACLYRWFKSSGSSTCPLCRNKFSFKRHT